MTLGWRCFIASPAAAIAWPTGFDPLLGFNQMAVDVRI
jgi:hypothetical protein